MSAVPSAEHALATLEQQVGSLVSLCRKLMEANRTLIRDHTQLQARNHDLHRRNQQASTELEKFIRKIKSYDA